MDPLSRHLHARCHRSELVSQIRASTMVVTVHFLLCQAMSSSMCDVEERGKVAVLRVKSNVAAGAGI
jgi:hypothetical protein